MAPQVTGARQGVSAMARVAPRVSSRNPGARLCFSKVRLLARFVTIATLCVASTFQTTNALSLAVDVGSETTTVAVTRRGGTTRDVAVVPDDRGERRTPSLVGWTELGDRVFGTDANSLRMACPSCVMTNPKALLGIPYEFAETYWVLRYGDAGDWIHAGCTNASGVVQIRVPKALQSAAFNEFGSTVPPLAPETVVAALLEDAARRAFVGTGEGIGDEGYNCKGTKQSTTNAQYRLSPFVRKIETLSIAVPNWWSQAQRQKLLRAARIAGFAKTALVSEAAAACVVLAQRMQDDWNKELKERLATCSSSKQTQFLKNKVYGKVTLVVVGVGARNSFAAAARITGEVFGGDRKSTGKISSSTKYTHTSQKIPPTIRVRIEMLQSEWEDGNSGGGRLDLDVAIRALRDGTRLAGAETKTKKQTTGGRNNSEKNTDVLAKDRLGTKNHKSAVRLLTASQRAKEVLSANTETVLDARGFFPDGGDLTSAIGRDVFENSDDGNNQDGDTERAASNTIAVSIAPLRRLLKRVGGVDSIDFIELVGGGARVPAVQKAIENVVAQSSDTTSKSKTTPIHKRLNLEETVAVGAGIVGTNSTKRSEASESKQKAKDLLSKKKTNKSTARRVRALEADSAAASRQVKETPSLTDSYPHLMKAFVLSGSDKNSENNVEHVLFRPGASVPSRNVVSLDLVRDDTLVIALTETARTRALEAAAHSEETEKKTELDVFGRVVSSQTNESGSVLPPSAFPSPFATYRVTGVHGAVKKAFVSAGQTAAAGATGTVRLHFALDRSGLVVFEKATVEVEVADTGTDTNTDKTGKGTTKKEKETKPTRVVGALVVTEVSNDDSFSTKLAETEIDRQRKILRWLRKRDASKLEKDAALSALEGDALRLRDRLERSVMRGEDTEKLQEKQNLENVLHLVDLFLSTETETELEETKLLRLELSASWDDFFESMGPDDTGAHENGVDEVKEGEDYETEARKTRRELEELVEELVEKLEACEGRRHEARAEL